MIPELFSFYCVINYIDVFPTYEAIVDENGKIVGIIVYINNRVDRIIDIDNLADMSLNINFYNKEHEIVGILNKQLTVNSDI